MPLNIQYNIKKDAWNYWSSINKSGPYTNPLRYMYAGLIKKIKRKTQFQVLKMQKKRFSNFQKSPLLGAYINALSKAWNGIEKKYFDRLKNITKKPICSRKFKVYITTIARCPYNAEEKWFMINFFSPIPHAMRTIGHEIMHLQFHKYFWKKIEKEIGEQKTGDLKEALTVLLNLEFKDLWFVEDEGYEKHKNLREFIAKQWQKQKDFNLLLDKCVEYLKK